MGDVTIRELRNHGGDVLDRVARGERVTITRDGRAVGELHPAIQSKVSPEALIERWRRLPIVDPVAFRADLDRALDNSL